MDEGVTENGERADRARQSDRHRPRAVLGAVQHLLGWHERWRGAAQNGGWTIHVGDETTYLALYTEDDGVPVGRYAKGVPLNHVGLLVDDLDAAERVISEAGLKPFGHGDYEPGRRFYFFDWDGIEFEVVSYQ